MLRGPMFSARTGWDRTENPLARAVARVRAAGRSIVDLTESNPTRADVVDAAPAIAELGHPRGARYEPHALGHPIAREAIARGYYARRGIEVDPARVVVSASTSESYAWLFQLLADPGDEVLVPSPSYPLFDWLASLAGVTLRPWHLAREAGFALDLDALPALVGPRTRAIVLVHPNNPTGSFVRRGEAAALVAFAAERGLALVVDEVFLDHAHADAPADRVPSFAATTGALAFVLGGLSKLALLPQCKLGWTVVAGPAALADEALARLEIIADTYLSASTPVQLALPALLAGAEATAAATRSRLATNLAALDRALAALGPDAPVRRLPVHGGWSAILEVPRTRSEDAWVERLLVEEGVLVHPGWFFDLDREGFLVVSLLPEPATFEPAVRRALGCVAGL